MLVPHQQRFSFTAFFLVVSLLTFSQSATLHYSTEGHIETGMLGSTFDMAPETFPSDLEFSSDGSRMYVVGNGLDNVYEFLLSTAYDVSSASIFDTLDIAAEEVSASGIAFNNDGSKMFIVGSTNDQVIEYDLSFPFDLYYAAATGQVFDIATEDGTPADIEFNHDGTKLFMLGNSSDNLFEYTLSNAYDITTAVYTGNFFNFTAEETGPTGVTFNANGTRLFMVGSGGDRVFQYDLSVAYDVMTATYSGITRSIVKEDATSQGIFLGPDGTQLFMVGAQSDDVFEYDLSNSAFTESAANDGSVIGELIFRLDEDWFTKPGGILGEGVDYTFTNLPEGLIPTISVSEDSITAVLTFNGTATDHDDTDVISVEFFFGNSAFFFGDAASVQESEGGITNLAIDFAPNPFPEVIYSTAVDIGTGQIGSVLDISSFDTAPTDVTFNNDGSKMYLVGTNLDSIYEFDLAPNFDISSATLATSFFVGFEETSPSGITFNSSGTRMYIVGFGSDAVSEYLLTIAFDLTSASHTGNVLSVFSEDSSPTNLAFNADGTRLFVLGNVTDNVFEYDLSLAYDLSTASYTGNSLTLDDSSPTGLAFNANGSRMFITGATGDRIFQYDLGNDFDITSASFSGVSLDASGIDPSLDGMALSADGTKAFVVGASNDNVYEINLTPNAFYEAEANDGSLEGEMIIKIVGDSFNNPGGSLTDITDYSITNLPAGIFSDIFVSPTGQYATLSLLGTTSTHDDTDGVSDLQFTFENSAFSTTAATSVINAAPGNSLLQLNFAQNPLPEISYSARGDISSAIHSTSFSVVGEDPTPTGMTFNNDGSKLFVVGQTNDGIYEYTLGTNYDLTTATLTQSLSIVFEESSVSDIIFNPSGTRMYIVGFGSDGINEFILQTAFDLSTASFTGKTLSVASEDTSPQGIAFNSDGTQIFMVGNGGDMIYEYSISVPYDISTGTYSGNSFSIVNEEGTARGMTFNKDGTRLFVLGHTSDRIFQYNLSTSFDLNSIEYSSVSFSTVLQDSAPESISISNDGLALFVLGSGTDHIYSYSLLPHAFIENGSNEGSLEGELIVVLQGDAFQNAGGSFSHNTEYTIANLPSGLVPNLDISSDGTLAKITLDGSAFSHESLDDVFDIQVTFDNSAFLGGDASLVSNAVAGSSQLSISFADSPIPEISYAHPIDIATAQHVSSFDVSAHETAPTGVSFNNDGSKMFILGVNIDSVFEFTLSTNFDISDAVRTASLSVGFEEANPTGVAFNSIGTRMYIIGFDGDKVYEYLLELPFDLSTASFTGISLDVSSENTTPRDLVFSNDGFSMFVVDSGTDSVYQYSFSTPYNLSSGSHVNSVSIGAQESLPTGLAFNQNGTKLFIVGASTDRLYQYNLGDAYDLTTATFSGVQFSTAGEELNSESIAFSNDGTKLFVVGSSSDNVHSYDLTKNAFIEKAANDGELEGEMLINLIGDQFSVSDGLLNSGDFSVTNIPLGITADIYVESSGIEASLLLSGQANVHDDIDDVVDFQIIYQDGAFLSGTGASSSIINASGAATSGMSVDFASNPIPSISYSHTIDIATKVFNNSFDISGNDNNSTGIAFNNDGTKAFMTGSTNDRIYEFTLSTPYDLASVTLTASQSIAFEDAIPTGLAFNADGTRLFMIGTGSDHVYEYLLSSPFDISLGSFSYTGYNFDVSAIDTTPSDVQFNTDGSKMYIVGIVSDSVYQYDLGVRYDMNSAIYGGAYYLGTEDGSPLSISFNANGTQMIMLGSGADKIFSYTLGSAFDVQTAVFSGVESSIGSEELTPEGMAFSKDGTKMFITGASSDNIISYDLTNTVFRETAANDGEIEGEMLIDLIGDQFSISDGLLNGADFNVTNLPVGMVADIITSSDSQSAVLLLSGQTNLHDDVDDVVDLQITYQDGAFLSGTGASSSILNASGAVTSGMSVNFAANPIPTISYSHRIDISTAELNNSFDISGNDNNSTGIAFNDDGTKAFVTGSTNDRIYEYALGAPYDLSSVVLTTSQSIAFEDTTPTGLTFNADGTRLFMIGTGSDRIHEYQLTNPFDVSAGSFSYTGNSFDVSGIDTTPSDVQFNSDGSKMYVLGIVTDSVYQYDLGIRYDLETASYGGAYYFGDIDGAPLSISFNANGTQMIMLGNGLDRVFSYTLTIAYDVQTAVFSGVEFPINSEELTPEGIAFSKDGTKMFMVGASSDNINSYDLTNTAFRETAANDGELEGELIINLVGDLFSVSDGLLNGADFNVTNLPAGMVADIITSSDSQSAVLLLSGQTTLHDDADDVLDVQITYQDGAFLSGTGASSTILNASGGVSSGMSMDFSANPLPKITYSTTPIISKADLIGSFDVSSEDDTPRGLTFNPDGTKMFVIGSTTDDVIEYDLSVPYNITTAVVGSKFNVNLEETFPSEIVFSKAGTRMFMVGFGEDHVHEYILESAFDISTAFYSGSSFSVASEDVNPLGLSFSNDGSKMFMLGSISDAVHEYDLSTPYDLKTATFSGNSFDISNETTSPSGITFSSDGYTLLTVGLNDQIHQYNLTSPFDITTASFSSIELNVPLEDLSASGVALSNDGSLLYMVGYSSDHVHQYELDKTAFIESTENNGAVVGQLNIRISGDSFAASGSTLVEEVDYTVDNLPSGLVSDIQVDISGKQATLLLLGNSVNHEDIDDVSDVQITFQTTTFVDNPTSLILNSIAGNSNLAIDFSQNLNPSLTYGTDGDISAISFSSQFNVSTEDSSTADLLFNDDGSKVYIAGASTDHIYEYNLGVNFDISTAVLVDSLNLVPVEEIVTGMAFNSTGTRVYTVGSSNSTIREFALRTPYSISTAYYTGNFFHFGNQDSSVKDIEFSADGTQLYAVGNTSNGIFQYDLAIPFDISTTSFSGISFLVVNESSNPSGIDFNSDGSKLVLVGSSTNTIFQYNLGSNYDIGTASYSGISFLVGSEDLSPEGIFYENDGSRLFVMGRSSARILEYSLAQNDFIEGVANDGSVDGEIIIAASGTSFTNAGGSLSEGSDFNISNLPAGLTSNMDVASDGLSAKLSFSNLAIDNNDVDDVADLQFTFNDPAFNSGNASIVANANAVNSGFGIDFTINPDLTITTTPLSDADVTQDDDDVLIYQFNSNLSGGDVTLNNLYLELAGSFTEDDFGTDAFDLSFSVGVDDFASSTLVSSSTYNSGTPAPANSIYWEPTQTLTDGQTVHFYITADIDVAANIGHTFSVIAPTTSNFVILSTNLIDGGLANGQTFTIQPLDADPPIVSVDDRVTMDRSPELTGSVDDATATVDVQVNGNSYSGTNNGDGTWVLSGGTISPDLADGIYNVIVTGTDPASNVGTDATIDELIIDNVAPAVAVTSNASSISDPEITGTIDDPDAAISVNVEGNIQSATNNGDGTWTLPQGSIALSDGLYDVIASAVDLAGNVATDSGVDELTIDTTAPVITVNSSTTSIRSPELNGTIDDATATIDVEVEGNSYTATNVGDGTWMLAENTISPDLSDGTYDVGVKATDALSNVGNDASTNELTISTDVVALAAIAVTSTSFEARWSTGLDVKEYRIDISDQADFSTFLSGFEDFNAGTSTGVFVSPVDFSTRYYYRVRLVNTSDEVSANSNTVSVKTLIDQETMADSTALVQIYNALGGSSWNPAVNWTTARLRDWDNVALNSTRTRVEDANISGRGATGDMPNPFTGDAVGGLSELLGLDASNNQITGLMDFLETSITNLNVSNNSLHFDDLEPVASITTVDYSNQNSIQLNEGQEGSIEVRYTNNYNLSTTIGGSDNQYQWFRNDVAIGTSVDFTDNGNNLEIVSIDYDNMGSFRAEVTSPTLVPGLTIDVDPQLVLAIADFEVRVLGTNDQPIAENVFGALLETTRRKKGFDTLEVAEDVASTFTFPDVVLGNYLTAVNSNPDLYIGTYSGDEFLWTEADTIYFRDDAGIDLKIQVVPPDVNPEDKGKVSGTIDEDFDEEDSRIDARRRAAKRKCGLRRKRTGGRTEADDDFELIAYGETNDDGEFEFGFLPEGTYRFFVEYPGIPLDESSFVEFEVGEDGIDENEFVLAATVSEDGIVVELVEELGVINKYFKDLLIYPNPSSDLLNISYRHLTTDAVRVELLDITGALLMFQDLERGYDQGLNFDVSDYDEGIYILRFYDTVSREKNMMSYRIIIRRD